MKTQTVVIIVLFVALALLIGAVATLPGIGDRKPYIEPEPHLHTFGDWYEALPATCTEPGTFERKCTDCGEIKTMKTPSLGHVLGDWKNLDSMSVKSCTRCGEAVAIEPAIDVHTDEINYRLTPTAKAI